MKLVFDIDGVLADFSAAIKPYLNLRADQFPSRWNWTDLGITHEAWREAWRHWCAKQDGWASMLPLVGAAELCYALDGGLEDYHSIYYVTSRPQGAGASITHQTERWLKGNGLSIEPKVIVVSHQANKVDILRAIGADAMLDDHGPTALMCRGVCKGSYLLRQPWNRADEEAFGGAGGLQAVGSVSEFLKVVGAWD